ncbi:hypothetical protein [Phytohabitans rumicis]|uniref:hypothetical protein n=1 Tax=Phytohabitans rumicis TaxID=1076125 RepID=UPI0015663EC6|nr:hypothetical protein [Phytohabitans rumicis]
MTGTPDRVIARAAHARADRLEKEILTRWPDAWNTMDYQGRHPPAQWPDWCLLPMAGAASIMGPTGPEGPAPSAVISALYAWRFSRAVYLVEPSLMDRLLSQMPDHLELDQFETLPHWCVYVAGENADRSYGLWAHLEYDVNTGRPELRLLVDVDGRLLPIPVYLDRPSLTEGLRRFPRHSAGHSGRAEGFRPRAERTRRRSRRHDRAVRRPARRLHFADRVLGTTGGRHPLPGQAGTAANMTTITHPRPVNVGSWLQPIGLAEATDLGSSPVI